MGFHLETDVVDVSFHLETKDFLSPHPTNPKHPTIPAVAIIFVKLVIF